VASDAERLLARRLPILPNDASSGELFPHDDSGVLAVEPMAQDRRTI
jgi:hypothetical protein